MVTNLHGKPDGRKKAVKQFQKFGRFLLKEHLQVFLPHQETHRKFIDWYLQKLRVQHRKLSDLFMGDLSNSLKFTDEFKGRGFRDVVKEFNHIE